MERGLYATPREVIWGLLTFSDWWQPVTSSVIQVGPARRTKAFSDGIPSGLLATLDHRAELRWRMRHLGERDRRLLFLWYVEQRPVEEIARAVGVSRRQCFRRRAQAIRKIIQLGEPVRAA